MGTVVWRRIALSKAVAVYTGAQARERAPVVPIVIAVRVQMPVVRSRKLNACLRISCGVTGL